MIGETLGHYHIVEKIGAGGMGQVYKAEDTQLGRQVALKFLSESITGDSVAVDRFIREARAASALNHPNIVTIHEIGEAHSSRFIVMELVQGVKLGEIIAQRTTVDMLARIGEQVAKALAVAHAAGIVHRDIKPDNIMLRNDGYVKVLDFGLARLIPTSAVNSLLETAEDTRPGTLLGTLRYMSPQQARGEVTDSATDIFSLGIVLYQLATGQHPFHADSQIGILHAILSQTPVSPSRLNPEIPAPLDALILQSLEKDPRLRPTAAEMVNVLSRFTETRPSVEAAHPVVTVKRNTVGRKRELAELHAAFASADAGHGLVICVAGEPGIGKTTLVEEFLAELVAEGKPCSIARGRCSERLAGTEAYLPLLEALETLLQGDAGDSMASVMKRVAPTWYVQVAPVAASDSSFSRAMEEAKAASQERLKRELSSFLVEISRVRPLILSLDDLHWADVSTVDLLAYIGNKCQSLRTLIIGSYRPSDLLLAKHPFAEVKLVLQGRGACREMFLSFLTAEDVERYLALEFPEHCFPAEFASVIHAKTEGSPLFMADLVRYLRDRKVINEVQGRWSLTRSIPDVQRELPESIRSMIQREIEQLSDAERSLLLVASVQGSQFDSTIVSKVLGVDPVEVEERLEVLERVHLFVRKINEHEFPDSTLTVRYSFTHVLYQNALYASLTPTRRASLSAAVAQALRGFYGERSGEVASDLAILFETARDFASAADYFLTAARNSARIYANQEAVDLARRAIANAEKLPGPNRRTRVLAAAFELARYHETLSQFDQAIAHFELAEKTARESDDKDAQIQALCGLAMSCFNLKQLQEMRQYANRALELARAGGSKVGVASAETVLACERLCVADLPMAEEYWERSLPVLQEQGTPLQILDAFSYFGALHTWRLNYTKAERVTGWALQRARELGASFHLVENLFFRGMQLGNQGRLSDALQALEEARKVAEMNGERYWLPRIPNTIGWIYRELQDIETALRLDSENVALATEMGVVEGCANAHVNLAHDYLALAEPANAFGHLQEAERLFAQDVWFRWRYAIRTKAELASYWISRGDLKMAALHAAASLQAAEMPRARKYLGWGHKLQGDIALLEERVADARREYDTALQILERNPCPVIAWQILKAAAEAARLAGDVSASDELLGRACAVIMSLADSIRDQKLRTKFLAAEPIRELISAHPH